MRARHAANPSQPWPARQAHDGRHWAAWQVEGAQQQEQEQEQEEKEEDEEEQEQEEKEEEEEQQQQQQQHEDKEGRGGAFSSCSPRTSRQRRPCSRWP